MEKRDELYDLADMSELDEQILARAGEENILDRMKKERDKKTESRAPWTRDIREHWFSYTLLLLSFVLTEMTAFYLGTAPVMKTNPDGSTYIHFHTDLGHLATTIVYMLVFPVVTELAFAVSRKKFNDRETGNFPQQVSMLIASALSLASIVGTGVSGAFVIFATLGSVGFLEVPPSVQTWLIWIIPLLLASYGLLYWIYEANSDEEKSRKMAAEDDRKAEIADQVRMKEIERAGRRAIRAEAIRTYREAVARGVLSHREASEALSQGLSLSELEVKLRRDLTGDGRIGEPSRPALPASPSVPALPPRAQAPSFRTYTLDELLAAMGLDRASARDLIRQYRLFDANSAYKAFRSSGYLPEDFGTDDNGAAHRFQTLFCELAGVAPTWGSVPEAFNPTILPPHPVSANPNNGASHKTF